MYVCILPPTQAPVVVKHRFSASKIRNRAALRFVTIYRVNFTLCEKSRDGLMIRSFMRVGDAEKRRGEEALWNSESGLCTLRRFASKRCALRKH